jgi:predicted transcriptional regulator
MREEQVFTKRGRLEIMFAILSLCNNTPSKKTHVMYKCNLSFKQLDMYLKFLINLGFLRVVDEDNYLTTEKGREFIKGYQNIKSLFDPTTPFSR